MTSKLKCPYSEEELKEIHKNFKGNKLICPFCGDNLRLHEDYVYDLFACSHPTCEKSARMYGTEELWQSLIQAKQDLEIATKALGYCIERFKSLENVLDEKAEASDIPDNPDLYAWAVRIKTVWSELKEITGIDYKTEHK